jgi:hypothetical protein
MDDLILKEWPPEVQRPSSLPAAETLPEMLVVFIVPDSAKVPREHVKWWGDIHAGVATQVLVWLTST